MSLFHDISTLYPATHTINVIGSYLNQFFILIKLFISVCGAITIVVGAMIAIFRYMLLRCSRVVAANTLNHIRLDLARTIILGLEFFIAGDVIETTITPDFQALGILSALVIIRTILNFSLQKEIKNLSALKSEP